MKKECINNKKNKTAIYTRALTCLIFSVITATAYSQEIPYGNGEWDHETLGNHRAVIYVEHPSDVVKAEIPWRRLDNVDDKGLILVDELTGERVKNMYCLQKDKDSCTILFEPVSGQSRYYLYYMPGKIGGSSWFPDVKYEKLSEDYDPEWKKKAVSKTTVQKAKTISIQSQNSFHSFYPMEIPVTKTELTTFLQKNSSQDFFLFPEDRSFPIHMTETIPYRWYKRAVNTTFSGSAYRDECYAWQIGIFSPFKELDNVKLVFSDLKTETGYVIPSSALKCINAGGNDYLGRKFYRNVVVPKGEVRAMWILTNVDKNQPEGIYKGKVNVFGKGTNTYTVDVSIQVKGQSVENNGYDTPANMSRLNWLDATRGIDDEIVAPYTPVTIQGGSFAILGRKVSIDKFGFPSQITSSFTGSNHQVNGDDKDILSGAIQLRLLKNGKEIKLKAQTPVITSQSSGAVAWHTVLSNTDVEIIVQAKMECDGYINYAIRMKAKNNISLDDVQLVLPYKRTTAKYLMGMGKRGGKIPDKLEWKWQQEYANNMLWIGDVNAGMQLKLKHIVPDWKIYGFENTGPYKDWSNEGKGGCTMYHTNNAAVVTAYTGSKKIASGKEMVLNFGLLITPFHPLDNQHWSERYYHRDANPEKAAQFGATVMNVHHANQYNPFINYPFLRDSKLTSLVGRANKVKIRTKLYYTVRELSVYLPEIWALRHLDDEIFTRSKTIMLADTHEDGIDKTMYGRTGHSWLFEHLRHHYDPAWHCPPDAAAGLDWDMSIRTQGVSRWHNYYIEGLNYLVKKIGIRGIYLDGVGYDREIMKRVRKTLDRAADSCLIDFHSGNAFQKEYGLNSPANNYLELFPYVNSLWLGEMYDYNSDPDYWLVEMSGIPFGLYGEMLEGCGNTYRGMVYGMATRYYHHCDPSVIWKLWDQFGISGSTYIGYWDNANPIKTSNPNILPSVYLNKGKAMIVLGNWTDSTHVINLDIDWKKMEISPANAKIEIPQVEGLQNARDINLKELIIPASKGLVLFISE